MKILISQKAVTLITVMFASIWPVCAAFLSLMDPQISSNSDTFVLESMVITALSAPIITYYFFRLLPSHLTFLTLLSQLGEKVGRPWILSHLHALVTCLTIALFPTVMVRMFGLSPVCHYAPVLVIVIFSVMSYILTLYRAISQYGEFSKKMDKELSTD